MELIASIDLPLRLDADGVDEVAKTLAAALDGGARVIALLGSSGGFCRGMDLALAGSNRGALRRFAELLLALRGSKLPTVAVVDGEALGGGVGLLAACDAVIAGPRARFGLPEALFGLVPGVVLPIIRERTGPASARLLALRGTTIGAEEAHHIGLVDVIDANPTSALRREAKLLARANTEAVRWLRRVSGELRAAVLEGVEATAERLDDPRVLASLQAFENGDPPWGGA